MEQENTYIKYISNLISKHLSHSISTEEERELTEWIAAAPENKLLFDELNDQEQLKYAVKDMLAVDTEALLNKLKLRMNINPVPLNNQGNKRYRIIKFTGIAASLLFILTLGFYFYNTKYLQKEDGTELVADEILPGKNKAVLTLADGRKIDLNSEKEGVVFKADELIYSDGSEIGSESGGKADKLVGNAFNTVLTTPRGGQYRLVLSDGTKVWLNAGSTLKFPGKFQGKLREVQLIGEAYFEVRPDKTKPFKVYSKGQEISVLGTAFNIHAYEDEKELKTTLVNGKVRVIAGNNKASLNKETVLLPGQESVLTKEGGLTTRKADLATAISWKSGVFKFSETEMHVVMNQLSRWYDLEVEYKAGIPETHFYGEISRDRKLGDVLEILKAGGLNFKIVQRDKTKVLIVLPDK